MIKEGSDFVRRSRITGARVKCASINSNIHNIRRRFVSSYGIYLGL